MSSDPAGPTRVVFFGTASPFSAPPLAALLDAGMDAVDVRAVVVPALVATDAPPIARRAPVAAAPRGRALPTLPMLAPFAGRTVATIAAERDVPLFEVARLSDPQAITTLAGLRPDAICVACFPWRLPPALLGLPRLGCLNVHPSLLPDNRGPDPLFWTFRRGDAETGVTIHRMDAGLDTGPILAQAPLPVPEGIAEAELEGQLAAMGGWLLVRSLAALADGTARPIPQDASRATYYPPPGPDDYLIAPERPARLAYHFARGLAGRAEAPRVAAGGAVYRVLAAVGYDEAATLDAPWRLEGDVLSLACAPGVFRARVARLGA